MGDLTVIADKYEEQRLNSPNDLAVHSSGTIFFTDPPFGVDEEDRELDFSGVYQLSADGELSVIYDEFEYPNGIVFNADESVLYVNDSAPEPSSLLKWIPAEIHSHPPSLPISGRWGPGWFSGRYGNRHGRNSVHNRPARANHPE